MIETTEKPAAAPAKPIQGLTLRHNFSWTIFGTAIWSACNWLMFTALAKMSTPLIVGVYAFGIAVVGPIINFAQLNLRNIQATDSAGQYRFRDYLTLRLLCMAAALAVMAAVCGLGRYGAVTNGVILWLGLGMALDSLSDTFYGLQQQHERLDRMGISMAVKGVLSLAALTLVFHATHSIVWAVAASAAASAVIVFGYDLPVSRPLLAASQARLDTDRRSAKERRQTLFSLFWLTLPLGFTILLISLNVNISRYFIVHYGGERQLGIFAALSYLIVVGRVVVLGLGQAVFTRLGRSHSEGDRAGFRALLLKVVALCALLGIAAPLLALPFGKLILRLLYKPEYAQYVGVFIIILAGGGIGYVGTILGYVISAARHLTVQIPWFATVTVATVLSSWGLVPRYGLLGAAYSMLLASLVQLVYGVFLLRRVFQQFPAPSGAA